MKYRIEGKGYIEQNGRREYFRNHFFSYGLNLLAQTAGTGGAIYLNGYYNEYFSEPWYINGVSIGTNQSTPTTFNTSGNTSSVSALQSPSTSISTATNGSQLTSIFIFNFPRFFVT